MSPAGGVGRRSPGGDVGFTTTSPTPPHAQDQAWTVHNATQPCNATATHRYWYMHTVARTHLATMPHTLMRPHTVTPPPGTGIAPIRSVIQQRCAQLQAAGASPVATNVLLFFGVRYTPLLLPQPHCPSLTHTPLAQQPPDERLRTTTMVTSWRQPSEAALQSLPRRCMVSCQPSLAMLWMLQ